MMDINRHLIGTPVRPYPTPAAMRNREAFIYAWLAGRIRAGQPTGPVDILEKFVLNPPTVEKHLRSLAARGLIVRAPDKRWRGIRLGEKS